MRTAVLPADATESYAYALPGHFVTVYRHLLLDRGRSALEAKLRYLCSVEAKLENCAHPCPQRSEGGWNRKASPCASQAVTRQRFSKWCTGPREAIIHGQVPKIGGGAQKKGSTFLEPFIGVSYLGTLPYLFRGDS